MTAPTIRVELETNTSSSFFDFFTWGTSLWGGPAVWASDTALLDITASVRSLGISRGRARDIDEFRPGTLSVEFNNDGRRFDPTNTDSDLYGSIEPMRAIVITATVGGTDYPLFYGYVQEWTVDYRDPTLPLATVNAADGLAILSNQQMAAISADYDGELSGSRVTRVLNLPEVSYPADKRSIDAGLSTFGDTTFGTNAGRYLQLAAQSEGAAFYAAKDGVLTFKERNSAPGDAVCMFSDDNDSSKVKYATIDQNFSVDLLYNRVITSGSTGNEQVAENTTSQDAYQVRTLERTGQLSSSDAEMADQAAALIARFSTPEMRLRQVTIPLDGLAAGRQAEVLGLELTDRVSVEVHPPGGGSPSSILQAALVQGIDLTVTDGATTWWATVTLEAGERAIPFIWGDADLGVWGQNYWGY